MGAHRSQHFVPRAYLKHFSAPANSKAIGLFNIQKRIYVDEAPIKSQCAKPFLYGTDQLEDILAELEAKYDLWVGRGVLGQVPVIEPSLDLFMQFFVLVQFVRTEFAAIRMRAHYGLMNELARIPNESEFSIGNIDTSNTAMARDGVMMAVQVKDVLRDLRLVFLRNITDRAFVTCDDPAVFSNRVYGQRLKTNNFGFAQAGAFFYLPLSPRIAALLYDRDAYAVPKDSRHWATLSKGSEVQAFNELVFLKARENIYFSARTDFDLDHFDSVERVLPADWQSGAVLAPIEQTASKTTLKRVDEPPETGSYMIWSSMHYPLPSRWPPILRFKRPVVAYTNGSAARYVRRHTAELERYQVRRVHL